MTRNRLGILKTASSTSLQRWWALIEACILLISSKIALTFIPFNQLSKLLTLFNKATSRHYTVEAKFLISDPIWAINCICRRLPLKFVCFPRGVAAAIMLWRRGIDCRLCFGVAAKLDNTYPSHVWVALFDDYVIIGKNVDEKYTLIFTIP